MSVGLTNLSELILKHKTIKNKYLQLMTDLKCDLLYTLSVNVIYYACK